MWLCLARGQQSGGKCFRKSRVESRESRVPLACRGLSSWFMAMIYGRILHRRPFWLARAQCSMKPRPESSPKRKSKRDREKQPQRHAQDCNSQMQIHSQSQLQIHLQTHLQIQLEMLYDQNRCEFCLT